MFTLVVIIAAIFIMVKAAEVEGRSQLLWGSLTCGICLLSTMFIPLPLINTVIGLGLSFALMLVLNIARDR